MLTIDFSTPGGPRGGWGRRDFLRVGALGIGGLTLADLFPRDAQARAAEGAARGFLKDKSVVVLFLAGGPSQYETFDPKPDGFDSFTSIAGHIGTRLPGVRFASYFPKLAARADRLTVARSLVANTANHAKAAKNMLTGGIEDPINSKEGGAVLNPSLGALVAQAHGASDRRTGMPTHAFVPPVFRPVDGLKISSVNPGVETGVLGSGPGNLGSAFAPFSPLGTGGWGELLQPRLPAERFDARRDLLRQFEQLRRLHDGRVFDDLDAMNQQAYEVLLGGGIAKALDLSLEDPRVRAAYDTSRYPMYGWGKDGRWQTEGPSTGFPLGDQMLLARRLCEAGSRFVTVVHSNWDMHGGESIWGMQDGMEVFAPPLDHAVATFVDDVEQRGLSDRILLVVVGEFGRTAGINKNAGRDHNPNAGVIVFAGGGLRHGQVVGATDARGGRVERDPVGVNDLCATLTRYLFDLGELRASREASPALKRVAIDHGQPIASLFS